VLPLDLLADSGLRLDDLVLTPNAAVALLASTAASAVCPRCGTPSVRVHSRYRRLVADLPCRDRPLALRLLVRHFRCAKPDCPQAIFCERLPGLAGAHARSTHRLDGAHRAIGFALGGEAGSRLADRLEMPTSPDTLLRRVKDYQGAPPAPPRVIGVDDWALRKGQRYGTIVVDLERGCVLDILPGRDGTALKIWLREHPGVEVVSRDRWAAYAQAATQGAPQAKQVADRWHLLKNLREAVERLFGRCSAEIRAALQAPPPAEPAPAMTPAPVIPPGAPAPAGPVAAASPSPRQQALRAKRQRRAERFQRVLDLRDQGLPLRQIARQVGLNVKAVRRYLRERRCPDWNPGRQPPTQVDAFAPFIDAWVARGGRNAAALYRELRSRGNRVGYDAVRRCLRRRLGSAGRPGPRPEVTVRPAPAPPSARQLSFEFIRRPENREEEQQARLDLLCANIPRVHEGVTLATEFAEMVRKESELPLAEWLAQAEQSGSEEMRGFAAGLRQDEAAVRAALTEPWSNGPVEGQVNRLKLIKRSMYGRAGFRLLRARVLFAG
jgi:transposase